MSLVPAALRLPDSQLWSAQFCQWHTVVGVIQKKINLEAS